MTGLKPLVLKRHQEGSQQLLGPPFPTLSTRCRGWPAPASRRRGRRSRGACRWVQQPPAGTWLGSPCHAGPSVPRAGGQRSQRRGAGGQHDALRRPPGLTLPNWCPPDSSCQDGVPGCPHLCKHSHCHPKGTCPEGSSVLVS